jgi:hypothetical protein
MEWVISGIFPALSGFPLISIVRDSGCITLLAIYPVQPLVKRWVVRDIATTDAVMRPVRLREGERDDSQLQVKVKVWQVKVSKI